MSTILVVDDALADRTLVSGIAAKWEGSRVQQAADGRSAITMIELDPPDLILTDLHMPQMDGFQLVKAVRESNPSIPVILMTAKGSEEIAAKALKAGAASYVPKRSIAVDLAKTLEQVTSACRGERTQGRLMHHVSSTDTSFTLFNDRGLIRITVDHVLNMLFCLPLQDQTERLRVGIALEEALNNAFFHGNLHVQEEAGHDKHRYSEVAAARRNVLPYSDRRIHLRVIIDRDHAEFIVGDDGPGFDWKAWIDVHADDQPEARGIALMRSVMDEVEFNSNGNQVILRKSKYVQSDEEAVADDDAGI